MKTATTHVTITTDFGTDAEHEWTVGVCCEIDDGRPFDDPWIDEIAEDHTAQDFLKIQAEMLADWRKPQSPVYQALLDAYRASCEQYADWEG